MRGVHTLTIENNRFSYQFTLRRNITKLIGNSASGKTHLHRMIKQYKDEGEFSGVRLKCDTSVMVPETLDEVEQADNAILVIDETSKILRDPSFPNIVKKSTCYFLLITRLMLDTLPYSIQEIYEIHSTKNEDKIFNTLERAWKSADFTISEISKVFVEDSGSGFKFYKNVFPDKLVETVKGRCNFTKYDLDGSLIIADGAAFGSQMLDLFEYLKENYQSVQCFFPESFEWTILKIMFEQKCNNELVNTADYVESSVYESWEQFFTKLLTDVVSQYSQVYSKHSLPKQFLTQSNFDKVKQIIFNGYDRSISFSRRS